MTPYVELSARSAFSFLEAASTPERLVDEAARLELPALALVDVDGVYGAPRFHKAAQAAGVRPLVGPPSRSPTARVSRSSSNPAPATGRSAASSRG